MSSEHRRFERIPQRLKVSCRTFGVRNALWKEAIVLDFSAAGIRLQAPEWYQERDRLELLIALPTSPEPVTLEGLVVRSRRLAAGSTECAIEFTNVTASQQFELDELVQFLKQHP
jgi:hypothetical protein